MDNENRPNLSVTFRGLGRWLIEQVLILNVLDFSVVIEHHLRGIVFVLSSVSHAFDLCTCLSCQSHVCCQRCSCCDTLRVCIPTAARPTNTKIRFALER